MMKLSVIVPVYNAENELKKSIESILSQTEKNIEIILVDDGSSDKSLYICKEFEKKDGRIKVIHQENSGVSVARNTGIGVATGEYIGFVDSDDWIELNMYERLLSEAQRSGADVVMCDATSVYDDGQSRVDTITQLTQSIIIGKKDFTPNLLLEMAGSACRCIYRSELLKFWGIQFPVGIKFSEDRIWNLYAFGHANKLAYLKESYYNRYVNMKSAVHRFHRDHFEACKLSADGIQKAICEAWGNAEAYQTAYLSQLIAGAFSSINNYYYKTSTLTLKERIIAVERLCEDNQLLKAIEKSNYGGIHARWISKKNKVALILYAKLANWKHGR